MDSVLNYLFEAASFMPHGVCLAWRPDLVALHAASDLAIFAAYSSIPLALVYFMRKRSDLEYKSVFGLFAAFILACGATHAFGVLTLWQPLYGLQGMVKLMTALVSVTTAVLIWPILPRAIALPSPAQLRSANDSLLREIEQRKRVEGELRLTQNELERHIQVRTRELRESEERLNLAVGGSRVGIWDWKDVTQDEIYLSPMLYSLLGYEDQTFEAGLAEFQVRLHPDDRKRTFATIRAHTRMHRPAFDIEYRLKHSSGGYRWFRSTGQVSWNDRGKPTRMTGTLQDIDSRKRSEEKLRSTATELEAVIATAVDGIIIIDARGMVRKFNPACERLFGYQAGEVIGQNVRMLMPEGYAREHDQYLENYRSTGEAKIIGIGREVVGRRKAGTEFPIDLSVGKMQTDGSWGYVGVIHDITERKQAEIALEGNMRSLKRSNEELEQFAYIASHDLQEPLRMVSSYCDLLKRRYQDKLDEDANDFINFAVDGAERMRGLIDDLLAFSRIGRSETVLTAVDCNGIMQDVAKTLAPVIEESDADFQWDDLPVVSGRQRELSQLFQNLVGNALKFRGDAPPQVRVSCTKRGGLWHFAVKDNGIGIDRKHAGRIFRMFQRLHGKDKYPGTGIGLTICKKIVEGYGGTIWVDPEVESGTTVRFTLSTG